MLAVAGHVEGDAADGVGRIAHPGGGGGRTRADLVERADRRGSEGERPVEGCGHLGGLVVGEPLHDRRVGQSVARADERRSRLGREIDDPERLLGLAALVGGAAPVGRRHGLHEGVDAGFGRGERRGRLLAGSGHLERLVEHRSVRADDVVDRVERTVGLHVDGRRLAGLEAADDGGVSDGIADVAALLRRLGGDGEAFLVAEREPVGRAVGQVARHLRGGILGREVARGRRDFGGLVVAGPDWTDHHGGELAVPEAVVVGGAERCVAAGAGDDSVSGQRRRYVVGRAVCAVGSGTVGACIVDRCCRGGGAVVAVIVAVSSDDETGAGERRLIDCVELHELELSGLHDSVGKRNPNSLERLEFERVGRSGNVPTGGRRCGVLGDRDRAGRRGHQHLVGVAVSGDREVAVGVAERGVGDVEHDPGDRLVRRVGAGLRDARVRNGRGGLSGRTRRERLHQSGDHHVLLRPVHRNLVDRVRCDRVDLTEDARRLVVVGGGPAGVDGALTSVRVEADGPGGKDRAEALIERPLDGAAVGDTPFAHVEVARGVSAVGGRQSHTCHDLLTDRAHALNDRGLGRVRTRLRCELLPEVPGRLRDQDRGRSADVGVVEHGGGAAGVGHEERAGSGRGTHAGRVGRLPRKAELCGAVVGDSGEAGRTRCETGGAVRGLAEQLLPLVPVHRRREDRIVLDGRVGLLDVSAGSGVRRGTGVLDAEADGLEDRAHVEAVSAEVGSGAGAGAVLDVADTGELPGLGQPNGAGGLVVRQGERQDRPDEGDHPHDSKGTLACRSPDGIHAGYSWWLVDWSHDWLGRTDARARKEHA